MYFSFNGRSCLHVESLIDEFNEKGLDTSLFEGVANSFTERRGVDPSFGTLIIPSEALWVPPVDAVGGEPEVLTYVGRLLIRTGIWVQIGEDLFPAQGEEAGVTRSSETLYDRDVYIEDIQTIYPFPDKYEGIYVIRVADHRREWAFRQIHDRDITNDFTLMPQSDREKYKVNWVYAHTLTDPSDTEVTEIVPRYTRESVEGAAAGVDGPLNCAEALTKHIDEGLIHTGPFIDVPAEEVSTLEALIPFEQIDGGGKNVRDYLKTMIDQIGYTIVPDNTEVGLSKFYYRRIEDVVTAEVSESEEELKKFISTDMDDDETFVKDKEYRGLRDTANLQDGIWKERIPTFLETVHPLLPSQGIANNNENSDTFINTSVIGPYDNTEQHYTGSEIDPITDMPGIQTAPTSHDEYTRWLMGCHKVTSLESQFDVENIQEYIDQFVTAMKRYFFCTANSRIYVINGAIPIYPSSFIYSVTWMDRGGDRNECTEVITARHDEIVPTQDSVKSGPKQSITHNVITPDDYVICPDGSNSIPLVETTWEQEHFDHYGADRTTKGELRGIEEYTNITSKVSWPEGNNVVTAGGYIIGCNSANTIKYIYDGNDHLDSAQDPLASVKQVLLDGVWFPFIETAVGDSHDYDLKNLEIFPGTTVSVTLLGPTESWDAFKTDDEVIVKFVGIYSTAGDNLASGITGVGMILLTNKPQDLCDLPVYSSTGSRFIGFSSTCGTVGEGGLGFYAAPTSGGGGYDPCTEPSFSLLPTKVFGYGASGCGSIGFYDPDIGVQVKSVKVDEVTHVAAGVTFDWDTGTNLVGSNTDTAATATNPGEIPLTDNQDVVIMRERKANGDLTGWFLIEAATNILEVEVNQVGGVIPTDADFEFDSPAIIRGFSAPTGTVKNSPGEYYDNNEKIFVIQQDDKEWAVLQRSSTDKAGIGIVTVEISAANYVIGGPSLTLGSGTIEPFIEQGPFSLTTLDQDVGNGITVYTTVEAITPVNKIVQWKMINNRRIIDVEPCNTST